MGSILCPETDTTMLDKIYATTNIRFQPCKGIITPVCECCRTRIDDYDASFKPYLTEYVAVPGECFPEDAFSVSVDPLADASFNEQSSSNDDVLDKGKDEVDGLVSDKQDLCNDDTSARGNAKLHYDQKVFQCEVCSKLFNHVGNFNKHRRVHCGEKPYACEYCEMRFSNSSNKKAHEKRHRDERTIVCEVCSKRFHDMHHLERHRTVHRKSRKGEN
uniref:C2H2-type domain-containing protein n=1 Tax=Anopheles quadriannulatus TaxID=34691 RepID=A0A182X5Y2_ANOQN